jgi:hypothetical protein
VTLVGGALRQRVKGTLTAVLAARVELMRMAMGFARGAVLLQRAHPFSAHGGALCTSRADVDGGGMVMHYLHALPSHSRCLAALDVPVKLAAAASRADLAHMHCRGRSWRSGQLNAGATHLTV